MSNKEYVLSKKPGAYCERVNASRIKGLKEIRYYIKVRFESSYLAVEKTEAKAWKEAKEILELRENN
jgi:hypothetical protein